MAIIKKNTIVKPSIGKEKESKFKLLIPNIDLNMESKKTTVTFDDISWFIHGMYHVGKTSLFTQFKNSFIISFDAPNKTLDYNYRYANDYETVLGIVNAIINRVKSHNDIKNVIFDNVRLYGKAVGVFTCKQLNLTHMGGNDMRGQDWAANETNMLIPIFELIDNGITVHGITHTKKDDVFTVEGKFYNVYMPNGGTQGNNVFCQQTYITGRYTFNTQGDRILLIAGDNFVEAASKVKGHFLFSDGTPMREIPLGRDEIEAYDNLVKAFENGFTQTRKVFKKKV